MMKWLERPENRRQLALLAAVAAAGLFLRVRFIAATQDVPTYPDLMSFLEPAQRLAHPFDTSPREPLFVWWLWGLDKLGLASPLAIRAATCLWFAPCLALFFVLARRFLGPRWAWGPLALYTALPSQVDLDGNGLRHAFEGLGVLALMVSVTPSEAPFSRRDFRALAASYAGLVLTRINFLGAGGLLAAWVAWTKRTWRPLAALAPGVLLLGLHLRDNRVKYGDPMYSVTFHTSWFANYEGIGQPGFAANYDEWQKDTRKVRMTFRDWAFRMHSPAVFVRKTALGFFKGPWAFFRGVYFAHRLPKAVTGALVGLSAAGWLLAFVLPRGRVLALAFSFCLLPYAFVSHVFIAARFFIPFSPFALIFAALAAKEVSERAWALRPPPRRTGRD